MAVRGDIQRGQEGLKGLKKAKNKGQEGLKNFMTKIAMNCLQLSLIAPLLIYPRRCDD